MVVGQEDELVSASRGLRRVIHLGVHCHCSKGHSTRPIRICYSQSAFACTCTCHVTCATPSSLVFIIALSEVIQLYHRTVRMELCSYWAFHFIPLEPQALKWHVVITTRCIKQRRVVREHHLHNRGWGS